MNHKSAYLGETGFFLSDLDSTYGLGLGGVEGDVVFLDISCVKVELCVPQMCSIPPSLI